jgi:methylphosphotriester-DNA--protein-cysteine methyltransferase
METVDQIYKRYEAEFAAIAALDRRYYLVPSASVAERRDYAARQDQLEEARSRFYAELALCRQHGVRPFRRCRSMVHRSRISRPHFS